MKPRRLTPFRPRVVAWIPVRKSRPEFSKWLKAPMKVKDLIALLGTLDPELTVVINDDEEPDFGHITELRPEQIRMCAIWYPHRDRAPRFGKDGRAPNAIFIGARMPK